MKRILFYFCLGALKFTVFLPIAQSQAIPCKEGNVRNTNYMLRQSDPRCEGIIDPEASGSEFNLRSFVIGSLQSSPKLSLAVPKLNNLPKPQIRIQSIPPRYYQLDPLELKDQGSKWGFTWPNNILRQENIQPDTLRSLAQSGDVVLPVLFSKSSSHVYDIRIFTGNRTKKINLQILNTDRSLIYSQTFINQPNNEVRFTWNGKTQQGKPVPAGTYTLKVEAEVEQHNAPTENRRLTRQFAHNIDWLK